MVSGIEILCDPTTNSQETLASAHKELESDSGLDTLVGCMFQKIEKSDMACYWLEFMTMVEILMMNVNAVHTCKLGRVPYFVARNDALDDNLRSE